LPRCRECQQPIEFRETAGGKLQPVDPGGTVHFATCPARRERRPPYPEDVCIRCGSLDVERGPGTAMHHASLRCRDCGSHRWLRKPVA
jgi:DNA-directed RNA polymerase subunit RPC12/RpoP